MSPFVLVLMSFEYQKQVNCCEFRQLFEPILVYFYGNLICQGFSNYELFYTLKVVFHLFIGLTSKQKMDQRRN